MYKDLISIFIISDELIFIYYTTLRHLNKKNNQEFVEKFKKKIKIIIFVIIKNAR